MAPQSLSLDLTFTLETLGDMRKAESQRHVSLWDLTDGVKLLRPWDWVAEKKQHQSPRHLSYTSTSSLKAEASGLASSALEYGSQTCTSRIQHSEFPIELVVAGGNALDIPD